MRLLIATDAWHPQVNGVVRTYERLAAELAHLAVDLAVLTPREFRTVPCPTYPEIRLALPRAGGIERLFEAHRPDAVHIATEGPVGWMARRHCLARGLPFTTSFHTRFPDYIAQRTGIPAGWSWAMERAFHNAGAGVMVATPSLADELDARGFKRILPWTRGVDTALFHPRDTRMFGRDLVLLYVGRVAVEKNLEAFLALDLPGRKVVVGDGPALPALRVAYPDTLFEGRLTGEALAACYASADVFVFPSRTDTFGMVLLEAMASGVPIAAYPVTGPIDIVTPDVTGVLSENLGDAVRRALSIDRSAIRGMAMKYSWDTAARMFLANIETALGTAASGRRVTHHRFTPVRPARPV